MRQVTIFLLTLIMAVSLSAKKKGAPPMTSGAPGDRTCLTSKCHAGNDLNTDMALITIEGLPEVYTPNEIYDITMKIEQKGAKAWGFIATAADSAGNGLGELISLKSQYTQKLDDSRSKARTSRRYLSHTTKSIKGPKKGESPSWTFQWKAPEAGTEPASFYFAFNAGNGNKKKTGDYIYTRSVTVEPPTE